MLKMKRLRPSAQIPKNATPGSAGYDLYADLDAPVEIPAGRTVKIKHGIVPANCVGVIDSDYRGEVIVGLHNQSQEAFTVNPGDRVAQLVLLPVFTPGIEVCEELDETGRGAGGFGSTGR